MNKELEALYKLSEIEFETGDYMNDDGYMMRIESTEMYDLIRKALTPPTADEVCKELSAYYGKKVIFKENVFWYKTIIYGNEQWVREVSLKDLSKDNRGDLITMIGKFYESLEEDLNV